jgi:hydrogenase maturation protease
MAATLVLGLGNLLLGDDGAGLRLLAELERRRNWGPGIEFIDGGTQGLALLGCLSGRRALLLLDAVALSAPPGTVHLLGTADLDAWDAARATTAHEGNARELLAAARLVGEYPAEVVVVGIEPEQVRAGIGLSPVVAQAVPAAVERATTILAQWLAT